MDGETELDGLNEEEGLIDRDMDSLGLREAEDEAEGLVDALNDELGLIDVDGDMLAEGLDAEPKLILHKSVSTAITTGAGEGEALELGDTDALAEALGLDDIELDGLILVDGLTEAEIEDDGLWLTLGDAEDDGL